jgi:large subunit ribosomal protein L13
LKTYSVKLADIQREWHVIDAEGQTLGRLCTKIATLIRGKHKPTYTTHLDVGDYVIVVNAGKVVVTGDKENQKMYYRHSNYPGGLKSMNYAEMMKKHPSRIIEHAVKGMIPHNRLGAAMMKKLKIYVGPTHPHEAQIKGK